MPSSEEYSFRPADFSGVTSLLPIPNLVMFPHVMHPVHVSEPRHQTLLNDVLGDNRLITLAVLAPGWETDYHERPTLRPYACLGKVVVSRQLEDGTHDLLVVGLERVRLLGEVAPRKAYREATAMIREDVYPPNQVEQNGMLKRELLEQWSSLFPQRPQARNHLAQLFNSSLSLGTITDVLGYLLELRLSDKEALLAEVNVHRRVEMLLAHLADTTREGGCGTPTFLEFPPGFSSN
ncbi:MAG: LON peptidase substrate-binding domain-containing protein [Pirellulales bacterium]|nr:LON peptidase substrate-binding domain-containing protein [Pirellulales bacterium]